MTVVVNRPVANDDFANTVSATPVVIDAAGNDADPDGNDHLVLGSVALVSGPAHGSAALNGDGTITYTASRGFEGTDRLTYTISDKAGAVSNPGTVTIAVSAPPAQAGTVLNDDAMDTDEGNPVTVPVLGNDVSPVGFDPTTVKLASQPSHGTASVDPGSGAITYSPLSQFFGTDTFSYTVKDKNGGISGPGQVTVVVNRPTANDDFAETFGTAPVAINLAGNDTDPDGNNHLDPSTVALVGFPAHGTITTLSNGQVTYVANPGFSGTDRFTYTIKDMAGATSNTATATVVTDLGQISGRVFFDDNADGTQEPGEAGMAGQVFYIDAHGDGIRHADDASTTSDAEGQYTFKGLAAGSYVVRQDTGGNANLVLTGTSGATYTATVGAANPVVVGTPDGNLVISPVATVVVTPQPFPQGPADAATKFLQGVYRGVVGTTVTPAEVAKPLAKLEHSAGLRNRTAAAQSVWESAAHRQAAVTKDYQSILGRAPTASELAKLSKHFVAKGRRGRRRRVAPVHARIPRQGRLRQRELRGRPVSAGARPLGDRLGAGRAGDQARPPQADGDLGRREGPRLARGRGPPGQQPVHGDLAAPERREHPGSAVGQARHRQGHRRVDRRSPARLQRVLRPCLRRIPAGLNVSWCRPCPSIDPIDNGSMLGRVEAWRDVGVRGRRRCQRIVRRVFQGERGRETPSRERGYFPD